MNQMSVKSDFKGKSYVINVVTVEVIQLTSLKFNIFFRDHYLQPIIKAGVIAIGERSSECSSPNQDDAGIGASSSYYRQIPDCLWDRRITRRRRFNQIKANHQVSVVSQGISPHLGPRTSQHLPRKISVLLMPGSLCSNNDIIDISEHERDKLLHMLE